MRMTTQEQFNDLQNNLIKLRDTVVKRLAKNLVRLYKFIRRKK